MDPYRSEVDSLRAERDRLAKRVAELSGPVHEIRRNELNAYAVLMVALFPITITTILSGTPLLLVIIVACFHGFVQYAIRRRCISMDMARDGADRLLSASSAEGQLVLARANEPPVVVEATKGPVFCESCREAHLAPPPPLRIPKLTAPASFDPTDPFQG